MMKLENNKKQALDNILNRVGLQCIYMSVSHLFDVGYRHMTEENLKETVEEIQKEDEPKSAIMTNSFNVFLLETSHEISKVASPLELAKYMSGK